MTWLETCFWIAALCVGYTYLGYPLVLAVWSRLRPRAIRCNGPAPQSVSVVLAVRNEEARISRRLAELCEGVAAAGIAGEVIVVSDGSSDDTVAVARRFTAHAVPVRVLEQVEHRGKSAALEVGRREARGEIIVLADVRQRWAPDAVSRLLEDFASPEVGAVTGELVLEQPCGALAGVGVYWRFEKWLRERESRVCSTVVVTGAIAAVRRRLFPEIPVGMLVDDLYWPLCVAMRGYRVVHEPRAKAFDRLPDRPGGEFRRKLRTLTGIFQVLARMPAALLPWRNPLWLQFISHKVLRLVSPWAMLLALVCSAVLPGYGYQVAFYCQMALLLGGALGLASTAAAKGRVLSAAASFLLLHAAAWLAFWVWIFGREGQLWQPVAQVGPSAGQGARA